MPKPRLTPSLHAGMPFVLLCILCAALLLAGGASRADVLGQAFVRAVAWTVLILLALFGNPPKLSEARPVLILLALAILLAAVQLVPLPPAVWQILPGRGVLLDAAVISGQPQPWRPWSMVPGATLNSLSSLIVPVAVLALLTGLRSIDRARLLGLALVVIGVSALTALFQLSGAGFDNPLINASREQVSGTLANRNHFALLLAIGCMMLPVWGVREGRPLGLRALAAFGGMLVLALMIVGVGSRAGLIFAIVALGLGTAMVWPDLARGTRRVPRWILIAFVAGAVATVAALVVVSISADRAESVSRVFSADASQDMRRRGLPTVWAMVRTYFPFGSGLGGFDPIFRISEPDHLLKPTYFNHAHNDLLEVVLDAGLFGLLLMLSSIGWWFAASLAVWRGGPRTAKLGSAVLLLVLVASAFDYPARTPIIMGLVTVAGWWLARGSSRSALPAQKDDL